VSSQGHHTVLLKFSALFVGPSSGRNIDVRVVDTFWP